MPLLLWIILFCLAGGVLSVLAASTFLAAPERYRSVLLPDLIGFAIGTLLGAALIALIPHAVLLKGGDAHAVGLTVLIGILVFFALEKMVLWRHSHAGHDIPGHDNLDIEPAGALILVGDTVHNFVDGILIGAAFLTDIRLGIVTSIAIAAHEIPQELGDFAILLNSGFKPMQALLLNLATALAAVGGGVLAWTALSESLLPFVLAVAAASFIYVAVADLIPGLHKKADLPAALRQLLLIALGAGVIYISHAVFHG